MTDLSTASHAQLDLVRANLSRVQRQIAAACEAAGREAREITLIAVTKGRSVDQVLATCACGLLELGENRVEELEIKRPAVDRALSGGAPTWHMIGHIQSRKAERAAAAVALIHSLDSIRLAERLARYGQVAGTPVRALLQVNVSGEASKSGFAAATPDEQAAFMDAVDALLGLDHLQIEGLMTIAPLSDKHEEIRTTFARTRRLRGHLRDRFASTCWDTLSMGMTNDYVIAIQEGATMIRIGRALFEPQDRESRIAHE